MDSGVVRRHVDEHDEHHPHKVGTNQVMHGVGADDHHHDHEKKSVMKKVKAKAKKIKDTITKHGHHDHEHDHGYHYEYQRIPDDHDLDEEDDEDEEIDEYPEVHGALMYESVTVTSSMPGQVGNLGQSRVNFAGTAVMGAEPHHEPRIVVVSPTTEIGQSNATDLARTFVADVEKPGQRKVNLDRPMGLEEDPHAPTSRPEAYTPSNYQTKVTDPTGAGTKEIDIAPIQNSFARMNVHNEPKLNPEPKVPPYPAQTQYPSAGSDDQFLPEQFTATGADYPSARRHDQFVPRSTATEPQPQYPYARSHDQFAPEVSTGTKTQYPSAAGSHDQFLPEQFTATGTHYPSARSHDQFLPQSVATKPQYPYAQSHDQFAPELSTATKTQYPATAGSHDRFAREPIPTTVNKYTESPQVTGQTFNTTTTAGEKPHYESMEKPASQSSYTEKISSAIPAIADKAASAKDAIASKLGYGEKGVSDENQLRHEEHSIGHTPSKLSSQAMGQPFNTTTRVGEQPQYDSTMKPSNQSSYTEKISSATSAIVDKAVSAKDVVASKLGYGEKGDTHENQMRHEDHSIGQTPSNQSSYVEKISSATSAIADKAASAKDVIASKLGYGEKGDTQENQMRHEKHSVGQTPSNQSSHTDKISSATSAIADKAASAKDAVVSKLGYGEKDDTHENQMRHEDHSIGQTPSNQSSFTGKISSATSAITDKAVSAKDAVVSKLGYGEKDDTHENQMRHEDLSIGQTPSNQSSYAEKISSATSAKNAVASTPSYGEKGDRDDNLRTHKEHRNVETPSNQSSYTEKISSATSAIADKAITAKNVVALKLGCGEKGDRDEKETTREEHDRSENATTMTGSSAEYGKEIAMSLTEKLAPVYGKVAGVGSAVESKMPGTGSGTGASAITTNEVESGVPMQDKGVSVKEYLTEKLRPGVEDRALSEVISGALHDQKEESTEVHNDEDRTEVIKNATYKREEEPEKAEHKRSGKVTESVEVKRRLGTGDEKIDKENEDSNVNSPGTGVVDKFKGVVDSWFSKPGEDQSSQVAGDEGFAKNTSAEVEHVSQGVGERRLQESSN